MQLIRQQLTMTQRHGGEATAAAIDLLERLSLVLAERPDGRDEVGPLIGRVHNFRARHRPD